MSCTELLFEAVEADDIELVREFISQGADIHARVDEYDILSAAVLAPQKQIINIGIINLLLAAGANPNGRTAEGNTALYWATVKGEYQLVLITNSSRGNCRSRAT